jgi:hypothetical protein
MIIPQKNRLNYFGMRIFDCGFIKNDPESEIRNDYNSDIIGLTRY